MKQILVTGGSGFLGRHLIEALLASGKSVSCLDLYKPQIVHERLKFIEGSFTDSELLDEVMQKCDIVFHLASTTLPKSSNDDPLYDIDTNLCGAVVLLNLAVKHSIRKFIFISSGGAVYGIPEKLPVPEDNQTNPTCSYGIVKLAIEKYLHMYHRLYDLETCSLRISNPYGEHQRVDSGQGAVAAFCHRALYREPIEIWGDGSVVRDFVYVKDAVRAMMSAIDSKCSGEVINIGSGQGLSLNKLLEQIETSCGHEIAKEYKSARGFDVPAIYLDIRRAEEVLGWKPEVMLEEGINIVLNSLNSKTY